MPLSKIVTPFAAPAAAPRDSHVKVFAREWFVPPVVVPALIAALAGVYLMLWTN